MVASIKQYKNTAMDNGFSQNKDVIIKTIKSIKIDNFRTLKNREIILGENITLISGKNGTMKTSILGLIAHPFSSMNNAKDIFGSELKTDLSEVFKLSMDKDNDTYWYQLNMESINNICFSEPVRMYPYEKEHRHRVVVGATNVKGKGNFYLNTSYINFKRLYPIIDTNAVEKTVVLNPNVREELYEFIHDAYCKVLGIENFRKPVPISEDKSKIKSTVGPRNTYYDYNSISSGEDNLGNILIKMFAFQKNKFKYNDSEITKLGIDENLLRNQSNGIFCIDEIEAGLHPVAQIRLFEFLFSWSKKHNIQVVATTHSLYLIQHAIFFRNLDDNKARRVHLNIISTAFINDRNFNILHNPTYNQAYKELTFNSIEDIEDSYKINVLCEDDVAANYIKRIIKKREILDRLEFIYGITYDDGNEGTSCTSLKNLIKHGERLFLDSIVIYDPEVDKSYIVSSKVKMMILPSKYNLPLEKEIIKYIYDSPGNHAIFTTSKKEKSSYIDAFAQKNIKNLDDLPYIKNSNKSPTKYYKSWVDQNKTEFKKIVTMYVAENQDSFKPFRDELIQSINKILESKSLPTFEI